MTVNMDSEIQEQSASLADRAQPLDTSELKISHVTVWQGTIGMVELSREGTAADPIPGVVLLENRRVERFHAVQLEDDMAVH